MSDDDKSPRVPLRYQVVVRDLKKLIHCTRIKSAASSPVARVREAREIGIIGRYEELGPPTLRPVSQFVVATQ